MKKIAAHFLKSASINTAVKSSDVETDMETAQREF